MKHKPAKPKTLDELSMLEAADLVVKITNALNKDDFITAFELLGITQEMTEHIDTLDELMQIAAVRMTVVAEKAKLKQKRQQ